MPAPDMPTTKKDPTAAGVIVSEAELDAQIARLRGVLEQMSNSARTAALGAANPDAGEHGAKPDQSPVGGVRPASSRSWAATFSRRWRR